MLEEFLEELGERNKALITSSREFLADRRALEARLEVWLDIRDRHYSSSSSNSSSSSGSGSSSSSGSGSSSSSDSAEQE